MSEGCARSCIVNATAACDHIEAVPRARDRDIDEAHAVLSPRVAARQPRCLAYPEAAIVEGFDSVENDDGELPSLEAVCSANFSDGRPSASTSLNASKVACA
jgi:hypothetical protein